MSYQGETEVIRFQVKVICRLSLHYRMCEVDLGKMKERTRKAKTRKAEILQVDDAEIMQRILTYPSAVIIIIFFVKK